MPSASRPPALVLVGSDEPVYREQVESGATVLRTAPSHLRFGHFEYFAWSGQGRRSRLIDYRCVTTSPNWMVPSCSPRWCRRTARLIAKWAGGGLLSRVMNTDNMSLLGLTLDYGPYGFIPMPMCRILSATTRIRAAATP